MSIRVTMPLGIDKWNHIKTEEKLSGLFIFYTIANVIVKLSRILVFLGHITFRLFKYLRFTLGCRHQFCLHDIEFNPGPPDTRAVVEASVEQYHHQHGGDTGGHSHSWDCQQGLHAIRVWEAYYIDQTGYQEGKAVVTGWNIRVWKNISEFLFKIKTSIMLLS